MPLFTLPSSVLPGTSSLSPSISTLISSNLTSGLETSCAAAPDMSHVFGSPHLPPPPSLSLSDAAPYSPPPAYPPVFPYGPLLASARFPPPPNPSFARPASNITFFEGPQSHYPPDNTAYDRWSDTGMSSISYGAGGDHITKSFTHWPLPSYNPSVNINSNYSNSGVLKPEPVFQPFAPYAPVDSLTNVGPKFSPFSGFSNAAAAGMPSTPTASITSSLPSGHFTAFPPPNLPPDFPHSYGGGDRFSFNPHGPTFLPGMDPPPAFGPGNTEFMPEPFPSYLSRPGAVFQPSSPSQPLDHFHDAFPCPIPSSAETTPRPVISDSTPKSDSIFLSRSYYPPPDTFHGSSNVLSHTFACPSDSNVPGPYYSSEAALGDSSSDLVASFSLPYPPPHPGSRFVSYSSSAPPLYQDSLSRSSGGSSSSHNVRDEERRDRIVGETGKLLYQHLSPEEWRWKHYEPSFASFANALDPCRIFARVRPSEFNHFNEVDSTVYSTVPNSSNGFAVQEEGSSSGALKSQKEQIDILERSKAQNQPGPSLKLAASALAEMLASGSNGASSSTTRSMISQIEATLGTAADGFQLANAGSGAHARTERMLEDYCSSSESAVGFRDGRDGSSSRTHGFRDLAGDAYVSDLTLCSPTRSKQKITDVPEDAFCDLYGVPVRLAHSKASGLLENSVNPVPMNCVDAAPQSAKGGAMHSSGQQKLFSKGSAGIIRQPLVSTRSAKLPGMVAEHSATDNFNNLVTQCFQSSRPQSGRMRSIRSQPVGVKPFEDPTSVIAPLASKVNAASGLSLFGPHQDVSSGTGSQLCSDPSHSDQVKSTSCGSSPPVSQAHLDEPRSMSGPLLGAASRVLANLKWSCPESSGQTEVAYLGTGFHSLTASISNLSKVLFSLDSSALTPPDSAILEETLQSSILRLSECLLLEQARMNRNPATRFVGSDESSTSRQGRADGSLTDFDFGRHVETVGSTNVAHLKGSDGGVLPNAGRHVSPSQLFNLNELRATSPMSAPETVDLGGSIIDSHGLQRPFHDSYGVSPCSIDDVGLRAGKETRVYSNPKPSSSVQKEAVVGDDVIQLLKENNVLHRSSLECLFGAEERQAKLEVLVEELRQELEEERAENRGTVVLCEKILREGEISKGKAVVWNAQKVDMESEKADVQCTLQVESDNFTSDRSSKSKASLPNDASDLARDEKGERFSAALMKNHEGFMQRMDEIESRLAFLRARPELALIGSSGSKSGEYMDAVPGGNCSEDASLTHSSEGELQQKDFLSRPAADAPGSISHDTLKGVESRLALLQARERSMRERSSQEAVDNVEEVMIYPWKKQSAKNYPTLEERLNLLHGRPHWDNELGVFTETEPCTPAIPAPVDLDSTTGSSSGHSVLGLNGERVAAKVLKAMCHITSQLLVQSETISNIHTSWSQLSEQVDSKSLEKESKNELQQKEADVDISSAARQGYDGTEVVEPGARLIRSRRDWTEPNVSESDTNEFLGGQVCNVLPTNSAFAPNESDQFETMNEISAVRLLDSDIEISQPLHAENLTDYSSPSLPKENGNTGKVEVPKLKCGDPAMTLDSDDDSSWEHVQCVQFPQTQAE